MKKKVKHILISILVLGALGGGIIYFFHEQLIGYFIPDVEQVGAIQIKVKNDTTYISAKLAVKNKSFLRIEVDTLKYKISLAGKTYIQNKKYIGMILSGYKTDTVELSIKIPYVTIINDLRTERIKGDSTSYSINIFLQYATFLGKREMPVNRAAKLKIPQPPGLDVVGIKYTKLNLKSIHADASIQITNYGPVNLLIKNLHYSMTILKEGNLDGDYIEAINIKPHATTFINLPIEISISNIGKTILEVLINKDNYDYDLTMNARMESIYPVKESFDIAITRSGKFELVK